MGGKHVLTGYAGATNCLVLGEGTPPGADPAAAPVCALRIMDATTLETRTRVELPPGSPMCWDIGEDGRTIAVAGGWGETHEREMGVGWSWNDLWLQLVSLPDGKLLERLDFRSDPDPANVREVAIVGQHLVLLRGLPEIWAWPRPRHLRSIRRHRDVRVAFGPGPDSLITSTGQDGLWRWRVEPNRVVRDRQVCPHRFDGPVAFSPDRRTLVAGGNSLQFWDPRTWTRQRDAPLPTFAEVVRFDPTGTRIATAGWGDPHHQRPVCLFDAATAKRLWTSTGHEANVTDLAFSPDGELLVSGDRYGNVRIWDARTGQARATCPGGREGLTALAFHPAGQEFVSVSSNVVRTWNRDGKPLGEWGEYRKQFHTPWYRPDGTLVLFAAALVPGEERSDRFEMRPAGGWHAIVDPARDLVAALALWGDSPDGGLRVSRLSTGARLPLFAPSSDPGSCLAADRHHGRIALGHPDAVRFLRPESGDCVGQVPLPKEVRPVAIACDPIGRHLLVAGNATVLLYATDWPEKPVLTLEVAGVTDASFDAAGRCLCLVSPGKAQVFSVPDGQRLLETPCLAAVLGPPGILIVTNPGEIRRLAIPTRHLLA